ncbi:MAG: response regulator [Desulfuromonadaceae bacterium]|nr:response regulator [Desulfuromonadaceae bacterium]
MKDTPMENQVFPSVLVVDDNRLQRRILEDYLILAGYPVTVAENGKEAMKLFRSGSFQIVITDWVMPEMSGLELCKEIRGAPSTSAYTYIIIITSQESKNDIIAGLEAGADEYLVKPVHTPELQARLKSARRILELEGIRDRYVEEIKNLSLIDPVSGTFSRKYLEDRLPKEIVRAYRYGRPLSLMIAGICDFNGLITAHGHYAGDQILKEVAERFTEAVRKDVDWVARYSEGEFLIALPETGVQEAMIVAKRLRLRISSKTVSIMGTELKLAAIFGISGFNAHEVKQGMTMDILIEKCDKFLRTASLLEPIKGVQLG